MKSIRDRAGIATLAGLAVLMAATPLAAQPKPALIKNTDERGRVPFTVPLSCFFLSASSCFQANAPIPANRRFVVEHINGGLFTSPNAPLVYFIVRSSQFPVTPFQFAPRIVFTDASSISYAINEPFLAYFSAGEVIRFETSVGVVPGVLSSATIFLTGYLVDTTQ